MKGVHLLVHNNCILNDSILHLTCISQFHNLNLSLLLRFVVDLGNDEIDLHTIIFDAVKK